jgi:ribosomal-protein-alanine N-acetyltransferase
LTTDDIPALAELIRASREFLAPWEPARGEEYFTIAGQRAVVETALARHRQGLMLPHVILDEAGQVAGRVNLNDIVRGPFQNAHLGYWVSATAGGRGVATAAVAEIITVAFGEWGLHRLQAGTVPHNVRSQRVLERNGFTRFGLAPQYLSIAGRWQDHILYQLISPCS